jgi:hypothetical protein
MPSRALAVTVRLGLEGGRSKKMIVTLIRREPCRGQVAATSHWLAMAVLPEPGGAETRISSRFRASSAHRDAPATLVLTWLSPDPYRPRDCLQVDSML